MLGQAECVICRRRVWSGSRGTRLWANAATVLLKLLDRPESVLDIRPARTSSTTSWLVHSGCARKHQATLDQVQRQAPRSPATSYEVRPGRVKVGLRTGMPKDEIVRLLGPPLAEVNLDVYLSFRLEVPAFDGRTSQIDFLLYDVLPLPGRLLRIAIDHTGFSHVVGFEDVARSEQPMPVDRPAAGPPPPPPPEPLRRQDPEAAAEPDSWRVGPAEIRRGMPQDEVVALLGEPIHKGSLSGYLNQQLSVTSFGSHQDFELWLFDIHPTPGWLVRVEFRAGRVVEVDEVPR